MKYLRSIGLALLAIILFVIPVLAYTYTSSISVTESNGNDYDCVPIILPIDNTTLISQGFMAPDGLDTQVISTIAWPHMLTPSNVIFAAPIVQNKINYFQYTLGNDPPLTQFNIVLGEGGYITIADDDDLEPIDNWFIEASGYFLNANGGIYNKSGTIVLKIDSGDIVGEVYTSEENSWLDVYYGGAYNGKVYLVQAFDSDEPTEGGYYLNEYDPVDWSLDDSLQLTADYSVNSILMSGSTMYVSGRTGSSSPVITKINLSTMTETATVATTNRYIQMVLVDGYIYGAVESLARIEKINPGDLSTVLGVTGNGHWPLAECGNNLYAYYVNGFSQPCLAIINETDLTVTDSDLLQEGTRIVSLESDDTYLYATCFFAAYNAFITERWEADLDYVDHIHLAIASGNIVDFTPSFISGADLYIVNEDADSDEVIDRIDLGTFTDDGSLTQSLEASATLTAAFTDGSDAYILQTDMDDTDEQVVVIDQGTYAIQSVEDLSSTTNIPKTFTVSAALTPGEQTIKFGGDYTDIYLEVDSVEVDSDTIWGTIVDNANSLVIMSSATSYLEYILFDISEIGGETPTLEFRPDDIIDSDTIPDVAASGDTENDGTISWGGNPAGISVSAGYLHAPNIDTEDVGIANPNAPDIISPITQPGWFSEGSPNANDPFYMLAGVFSDVAASMPNPQNIPAQFIARLFAIIVMLLAFILAAKFLKHIAIACIVGTALAGFFHAWGGYWPFIFVFFLIIVTIGTIVLEAKGTI